MMPTVGVATRVGVAMMKVGVALMTTGVTTMTMDVAVEIVGVTMTTVGVVTTSRLMPSRGIARCPGTLRTAPPERTIFYTASLRLHRTGLNRVEYIIAFWFTLVAIRTLL